ncbi:hypothetical protein [Xanthomonas arboricola]|uniref:hypothetical protein n=1 Tax=Xanthomonas arboricola TaxID=56448 RepID=UPI0011AFEC46|nr:hypothetical protein [Xanthomonas arboricola]MBB3848260.1 hypothetical protein [Xanthomonas arboricola]
MTRSIHHPMVAHRTAKTLGPLVATVVTLAAPGAVTSGDAWQSIQVEPASPRGLIKVLGSTEDFHGKK